MKLKPRKKEEPIIDKEMKVLIFIMGILTDIALLAIFIVMFLRFGYEIEHVRTFIFVALGIDSLFYVFSCKSLRKTIFHINIFNNKFLIGAVLLGFALQIGALYIPFIKEALELTRLSLLDWSIIIGLGFFNILMIELGKYIFISKMSKKVQA